MVFVDTSVWYAYAVTTDPDHKRVSDWFEVNRQPVITSDYCADETLTLLNARGEGRRARDVGRQFFEAGVIELYFLTSDQIRRAWILFQQHMSAGWSFTDCTSKVLIDELGVKTAAALDTHFQQFGINVEP